MATNSERIEQQSETIEFLRKEIEWLRTEIRSGQRSVSRAAIDEALELLHDPYDVHNPFKIIGELPPDEEAPEGYVLRWINPRFRDNARTWRGWVPLQWGDKFTGENGEKLKGVIPEPPMRMQGPDHVDSYVRRGDVVLARLPKHIWRDRTLKPVLEDARRRGELRSDKPIELRPGVYLTGDGIRKQDTPITPQAPSAPDVPLDAETGEGTHRKQFGVK